MYTLDPVHTFAEFITQHLKNLDGKKAASLGTAQIVLEKPFIYTGGCWVLGNSGDTIADEESPTDPPAIVAWRPAFERRILAATEHGVHAIVLRPANVYGRMLRTSGIDIRV